MLHELLSQYLLDVETSIKSVKDCHIEKYEEEILLSDRANLRLRIRYSNGYMLEINEAVIVEDAKLHHLSYRYHFQDGSNQLIFRYDNTPHFPNIPTFPNHKHRVNKIVPTEKPHVTAFIQDTWDYLLTKE
jgi:hypothetical protein